MGLAACCRIPPARVSFIETVVDSDSLDFVCIGEAHLFFLERDGWPDRTMDSEDRKQMLLGLHSGIPDSLVLEQIHQKLRDVQRLSRSDITARWLSEFPCCEGRGAGNERHTIGAGRERGVRPQQHSPEKEAPGWHISQL